jgi:hypothetical protein
MAADKHLIYPAFEAAHMNNSKQSKRHNSHEHFQTEQTAHHQRSNVLKMDTRSFDDLISTLLVGIHETPQKIQFSALAVFLVRYQGN